MQHGEKSYLRRLFDSFGDLCRSLERSHIAGRTVFVLLAIHSGLLAYSAYVHSPTLNEPGHLVAGLSHWRFGRFELYRVNPPLVRMVAALPVMAVGYEEDWSGFFEGPGARPVFGMGKNFVAANGERSLFLFIIARWACIPFSLIGAVVCYMWARDLSGELAGVMACSLWCFSPNILAHASLITADTGGTALGLAACYTYWRWLKKPTWIQAALTGCVLGSAELAKTTLILFYPLWPLLWLAYRWPDRRNMLRQDWLREAGMLLLRMGIGLYTLNIGYGCEGSCKPLRQFHFVSNLFTGQHKLISSTKNPQQRANDALKTNRFAHTWLGRLPTPFPKNYLLGIDIQQADFESYGKPSYLRGEWRDHGWWYYYLYAAMIKVPLGTWALGMLALIIIILGRRKRKRECNNQSQDALILLAPSIAIFFVVSSKTGFSEHFRYLLPVFPYLFIWLSGVVSEVWQEGIDKNQQCDTKGNRTVGRMMQDLVLCAPLISLFWMFTSSMWIYPHSLSYFNETVGGPLNGMEHLLGSNVDWGQDYDMSFRCCRQVHSDCSGLIVASSLMHDPSDLNVVDSVISVSQVPDAINSGSLIMMGCGDVKQVMPSVLESKDSSSIRSITRLTYAMYLFDSRVNDKAVHVQP